ncbi:glycosyltransferase [candidate division KSB1 bacterium]|nr:glycosyltransferase [candidate division KSB1 bacterium]
MPQISACIISFNEEQKIEACLQSLSAVVDEIIVVDSNSTDDTLNIAAHYTDKLFIQPFLGHVQQKNVAVSKACNEWVLSLDCDERLSPQLQQAILAIKESLDEYDAYRLSRKTFYIYRWLNHIWYPDKKVRLFNKNKGKWGGVNPHDKVVVDGSRVHDLQGDLLHLSFDSISDHLQTVDKFTDIAAEEIIRQGKKVTLLTPFVHATWTFLRMYVFKFGFLDGFAGIVASLISCLHVFVKYSKVIVYFKQKGGCGQMTNAHEASKAPRFPPRITVLMACYNGEKYIAAAFDSLIAQTYSDFEVLVVDDASTDDSVQIFEKYAQADPRFRIVRLEKNYGVTHARHIGLMAAKGEFVAILDQDDLCEVQRFALQVAYFDAHPDVVVLGGYYGIVDARGRTVRKMKRVPIDDLEIRWRLTMGNCLIHSTVMYRRDKALDCGGYDLTLIHGEDMDLLAKIILTGKAASIPQRVAFWRQHQESVTQSVCPDEREHYYIKIVQRSLQTILARDISFATAASAHINGNTPSASVRDFQQALQILYEIYLRFVEGANRKDTKILSRALLQAVLRFKKRNEKNSWWRGQQSRWESYISAVLHTHHYRWFFDPQLFFLNHVSFSHLPRLWRISLAKRDIDVLASPHPESE